MSLRSGLKYFQNKIDYNSVPALVSFSANGKRFRFRPNLGLRTVPNMLKNIGFLTLTPNAQNCKKKYNLSDGATDKPIEN